MPPKDEIKVEFSLNELVVAVEVMRMALDDDASAAVLGGEDCAVGERIVERLAKAGLSLGASISKPS